VIGTDPAELLARAVDALPEAARDAVRRERAGAIVADARHVLAANDAYLALVGVAPGADAARRVPWVRLTPPELLVRDAQAMGQARSAGTSAPYAKEYVLPDGARVSVLLALGVLVDAPLPLFALVARGDDAEGCAAVHAWTAAAECDLRPAIAGAARETV
jgi:PAS domain-containing protein